jgi:hypothetical protein
MGTGRSGRLEKRKTRSNRGGIVKKKEKHRIMPTLKEPAAKIRGGIHCPSRMF